jgi:drug/metabolite transporter (DMT)-like permease
MIAVLGGLGAAVAFATATLCSSRSSRLIGPAPVVAWVMLVGLAVVAVPVTRAGVPAGLDGASTGWLALAGLGNVVGLLLAYAGLRIGRVGVVAPIASTEGAIAALIAVAAGEAIAPGTGAALAVVGAGVVLAAAARDESGPAGRRRNISAALYAAGAALAFGLSLYATGRVSADLPLAWAVLPARLAGALAVALPLALAARLRLTRRALPLVVASGLCEVLGFALFAVAARHGIAVSAVLASQFAALAVVGAFFLFRERLGRVQVAGVVAVVLGVAALGGLQA